MSNPIFQNAHNPGQSTTTHRAVEEVRQMVSKEGPHPEKGSFSHDYASDTYPSDNGGVWKRSFVSPSGARVEVSTPAMTNGSPHDVVSEVNGKKITGAIATATYLQEKFGL